MLDRLPWQTVPDGPHAGTRPLAGLATHSPRDPTVALLDAFAVVADVLTFYQERIINEGFLRTATEPRSVLELSRSLGYELGPGLAASAWLAFTVEEAAGAPEQVAIEPGVRVLSVPGQNERPQTFETTERIVARREWNQLHPATTMPQPFELGVPELWLRIPEVTLSPGDTLLLVRKSRELNGADRQWELRTVAAVAADPASGRTRVSLVPKAPPAGEPTPGQESGAVYLMSQRAAAFGHNAPDWLTMPATVRDEYLQKYNDTKPSDDWPLFKVALDSNGRLLLDGLYPRLFPQTWMALIAGTSVELCWVHSVETTSHTNFAIAARVSAPELRSHPGATAHLTALPTAFDTARRSLIVLGQGDRLPLSDQPMVNPAWGTHLLAPFPAAGEEDKVTLDRVVLGLDAGHRFIVSGKRLRARVAHPTIALAGQNGVTATYASGEVLFVVGSPGALQDGLRAWRLVDARGFEGRADLPDGALGLEPAQAGDPTIAELVELKSLSQDPARTTLRFTAPLKHWYDRATVVLYGNVALATHGETVREVLGSGDGGQPNQRFTLKRAPLTWVSAATATGRRSTLEVRVQGVLWHQVSSLHDHGPNSRVYLVQRDEQGHTTVVFGDGIHGARLPTGQENVVATYRIGTGLEGAVAPGKVMLFQTRPLGLRAVTNPLPATGAEALDPGAVARHRAPRSVLTLDRIVSAADFETFAESFAGIGKARAVLLRRGEAQRLHVTLALADGTRPEPGAPILHFLQEAMDSVRDTTTPVILSGFEAIWFRVNATLRTAPDLLFEDVEAQARAALIRAFAFERRAFGEGISASEVVALLQGVPGVEMVDLDGLLATTSPSSLEIPTTVEAWLSARDTRWDPGDPQEILPAQLLLLDPSPRGVTLTGQQVIQP
jgi:hypothetical protein